MRWLVYSLFFVSPAICNTFVGNGGDSTDLLLHATLRQINQSMLKAEDSSFCECYEAPEEHPLCESLERMDEEQVDFCRASIVSNRDKFIEFTGANSKVRFEWTSKNIMIADREFEAVASKTEKKITINKERFIEMTPSSRVTLVTHELFHLIDPEKYADDQPIGPFKGDEGARDLLDAAGASVAIISAEMGLYRSLNHLISGSKSDRSHWISFYTSVGSYQREYKPMAGSKNVVSAGAEYQYHMGKFGIYGNYSIRPQLKKDDTVELIESTSTLSFGVTYKINIMPDPTTRFGQGHLILSTGLGWAESRFEIKDSYLSLTDKKNHIVPQISLVGMVPLNSGFWFSGGIKILKYQYKYDELNVDVNNTEISIPIGVNYGF